MPKYRVLTKSFINNTLVEEGDEVDFDGEPGPNLEALDKPKSAKKGANVPQAAAAPTDDTENPLV